MSGEEADVEDNTQSQNTPADFQVSPADLPVGNIPWGTLHPIRNYLRAVELHSCSFTLGKGPGCDLDVTTTQIPRKCIGNISKKQFTISRQEHQGGQILVTIQDDSKNGTFLNGNLIGRGRTFILQDGDTIAIGFHSFLVFVFHPTQITEDLFLPPFLQTKYTTSKFLGKGATGEVRLVFEKTTVKPYAMKKIEKAEDRSSLICKMNHPRRIANEVNILKSLSHKCVVKIVDFTETPDEVFIALEYMEGGDLLSRILSLEPFPEHIVKVTFYQIALAVQYLHANEITHRDLKPANILLKTDEAKTIVKITDFGLSKETQDTVHMQTQCGTLHYLAPEILDTDFEVYDKKVDIWSMGVLLYYMLARELPFRSTDTKSLKTRILQADVDMFGEIWMRVSSEAKHLVKCMLRKEPNERLSVNEVLRHPWFTKDQQLDKDMSVLFGVDDKNNLSSDLSEGYGAVKRRRV